MFIASDLNEFHALFRRKLAAMLSPDELGAYILVLANSIQDDVLRNSLINALSDNEKLLLNVLENGTLDATVDDLAVFEKLIHNGAGKLPVWCKHTIGVWNVMRNPFRALRPARASNQAIQGIKKPFDSQSFNFNKPFLKPEILWEGKWKSQNKAFDLRVLYNKFPFIAHHLIIVPDPELQHAQFLTQQYHAMICQLVCETHNNFPGFAAGYNSLGACASVNHLHFQSFIQKEALPIELGQWIHNGGNEAYPMRCFVYDNMQAAWEKIQLMHDDNAPYNILYRPNRCYIIPRQPQGSDSVNQAVAGAGWIEECGIFVAADTDKISTLSEEMIVANLRSLSVDS